MDKLAIFLRFACLAGPSDHYQVFFCILVLLINVCAFSFPMSNAVLSHRVFLQWLLDRSWTNLRKDPIGLVFLHAVET